MCLSVVCTFGSLFFVLIAFYLVPYTCKERNKTKKKKYFDTVLWMSVKIAMGVVVLVGLQSLWLTLAGCCKDVSVVCLWCSNGAV